MESTEMTKLKKKFQNGWFLPEKLIQVDLFNQLMHPMSLKAYYYIHITIIFRFHACGCSNHGPIPQYPHIFSPFSPPNNPSRFFTIAHSYEPDHV
jgi:hypothetical protein